MFLKFDTKFLFVSVFDLFCRRFFMKSRFFRTSLILFILITFFLSFSVICFAEVISEENGVFESAVSGNVVDSPSKENSLPNTSLDSEKKEVTEETDSKIETETKNMMKK